MGKVDLFVFLAPFVEREVNDPAKTERVLFNQVKLLAGPRAGRASQLCRLLFFASGEEATIVWPKSNSFVQRAHPLFAMVLGDWAAKFATLAGDITKSGVAFAARPFVHVVEEFTALVSSLWRRNGADNAAAFNNAFKQAEARGFEMIGNVVDHQRIAQIGLVSAVI